MQNNPGPGDVWYPTLDLRIVKYPSIESVNGVDVLPETFEFQLLWKNTNGQEEWRTIPTVLWDSEEYWGKRNDT